MTARVVLASLAFLLLAVPPSAGAQSIDFVGVRYDRANFTRAGLGQAGHWFAQFGADAPVSGRPTGENARVRLPEWIAPLNHVEAPADVGCTPFEIAGGCLPTYLFRSFSQDGPARSAGGHRSWSVLRLPGGERGRSGAIVDPHTAAGNRNNTINRIQLRATPPSPFYVSVVTDTTAMQHDPGRTLVLRGNAGPLDTDQTQIESASEPGPAELVFNGEPDAYMFRVSDFRAGDYLKLRLAASDSSTAGASFSGLLFDGYLRGASSPAS